MAPPSDQQADAVATPAQGEVVREFGASEYLLYMVAQKLVRLVEFEGPVDPDVMERAFHQMVGKRTILRTRTPVPAPGQRPVFVMDDSVPPTFEVRERTGPEDWIPIVNRDLNGTLGLQGDPPIRAELVTSGGPGAELVLSCLHTVCDGRSLGRFCRDLLMEYEVLQRGEPGDPSLTASTISPAVEDVLPEWATPERGEQIVAESLEKAAKLPKPMPWPSQRGGSTEPIQTRLLPMDVPADQLAALHANARARGTTVFGVLGAALARAVADVLGPAPDDEILISNTLDIRDALRIRVPVENMGVYAGTLPSRYHDVGRIPEWEHAQDYKAKVTEGIDRNDHYAFVFLGARFVESFTAAAGDPLMTAALANLGVIEFPGADATLKPRALRGGLNIHSSAWPFVSVNAVGINGTLRMTVTYIYPEISEDRIREFNAAYLDRLGWYAAHP